MILTCPACATSYFVSDAAIGPSGRRVRCKSCGNDWRVTTDDTPLELDSDVVAAVAPGNVVPRDVIDEEMVTPAALPQAFRARAEQKRRARKAVQQGLAWSLTAILVLSGILAAYIWRDAVVARVPKLGSLYDVVGVKTYPNGLDFEAISTGFAHNDIGKIYISGALRNLRDHEIVAPPIRIALLDRNGQEYSHRIHRPEGAPILPGDVKGFAIIVDNTDGRFAETRVRFASDEEIQSAARPSRPVEAKAHAPEPAAETAVKATAARYDGAHGQAGNDGLRRISQLTSSASGEESDLDTIRLERVSATHG